VGQTQTGRFFTPEDSERYLRQAARIAARGEIAELSKSTTAEKYRHLYKVGGSHQANADTWAVWHSIKHFLHGVRAADLLRCSEAAGHEEGGHRHGGDADREFQDGRDDPP
jgi:hypothetical protein